MFCIYVMHKGMDDNVKIASVPVFLDNEIYKKNRFIAFISEVDFFSFSLGSYLFLGVFV